MFFPKQNNTTPSKYHLLVDPRQPLTAWSWPHAKKMATLELRAKFIPLITILVCKKQKKSNKRKSFFFFHLISFRSDFVDRQKKKSLEWTISSSISFLFFKIRFISQEYIENLSNKNQIFFYTNLNNEKGTCNSIKYHDGNLLPKKNYWNTMSHREAK